MAFAFRQAVPLDQVQLDPSLALQGTADAPAVTAGGMSQAPAMPQSAPQMIQPMPRPMAAPSNANVPALADIPVSPVEAALSMFFHGGTPGEAAQSVRAVKLKNAMDQIAMQQAQQRFTLSQQLDPRAQLDYLTSPENYVKSDAKNFEPISASEGQTIMYRGGQGAPGGYSAFAPKTGVSPSGVPYAFTKDGYQTIGPQQPGEKSVTPSGAVVDSHTGLTGQAVSVPNNVPLGTTPGEFIPKVIGRQGAPSTGTVPALAGVATSGAFDPAAFIKSFILPHEGGLNPHDMNGAPSKYGINQTANPGVDVAHLTPDQATQIYMQKYLPMSGAASLPPALAAVHLDTSIINPQRAQQFLNQSGGDPSKYMDLRDSWMQHMVQNNPAAAPYAKAWGQRNADLRGIVAQSSGTPPPPPPPNDNGPPVQYAAQPGSATSPGYHPLGEASRVRQLSPQETQASGYAPGAVVLESPDGARTVSQSEHGAEWARGQRDAFMKSEPYLQHSAASSAYNALVKNIGNMTGPSAYAVLDTFARTINPGAVARQGTLAAIEESLGLPARFVGSLQNMAGNGKLPMQTQQQILNAVAPFAQSHWDQANALYQANAGLAKTYHYDPSELTAPIGSRPERAIAAHGGAVTQSAAVAQARQAIAAGRDRTAVIQRLQTMGIDPRGL